jgi:hypothetical protein
MEVTGGRKDERTKVVGRGEVIVRQELTFRVDCWPEHGVAERSGLLRRDGADGDGEGACSGYGRQGGRCWITQATLC